MTTRATRARAAAPVRAIRRAGPRRPSLGPRRVTAAAAAPAAAAGAGAGPAAAAGAGGAPGETQGPPPADTGEGAAAPRVRGEPAPRWPAPGARQLRGH